MENLKTCPVCKTKKPKNECIEDDTLFFCSQECLDKSKRMEEKYCPRCEEFFYSEDEWSGYCLYCNTYWWLEEFCTEDYSDCWLETWWES